MACAALRRRCRLVVPWDFRRAVGPETYRPRNSVLVWLTVAEMLSTIFLAAFPWELL
jgi:hypothetical protein